MIKFLLIFVLFSPVENAYKEKIGIFDSSVTCEKAREEVQKKVHPEKDVWFVLSCVKATSTEGVQT